MPSLEVHKRFTVEVQSHEVAEMFCDAHADYQAGVIEVIADGFEQFRGTLGPDGQCMEIVKALPPKGRAWLKQMAGWVDYLEDEARKATEPAGQTGEGRR